jgi:peroxiredoxin
MNRSIKRNLAVIFIVIFGVTSFAQIKTTRVTVYVFLSETCPICQSYTFTLKDLYLQYKDRNIQFVGVFPNYYSTEKSIADFKEKYAIPFDLILDKNGSIVRHFNATITPEVFVESSDKKIIYSGRIDDSFYAVGKKRTIVTSSELANVLYMIAGNSPVTINNTTAVGCIIDSSE